MKRKKEERKSGREGSEWEGGRETVCEREGEEERQDVDLAAATGPPQAVTGEGCDEPVVCALVKG